MRAIRAAAEAGRSLPRHARRGLTAFGSAAAAAVMFAATRRCFAFAAAATMLFYVPALRNGSVDAGFLYGGDVLGFYWPSMVKSHAMLAAFDFTGIDISNYNGSGDLFLAANFFAVHPLIVLHALFTPAAATMRDIGRLLVAMLALHSFLACYFSLKLLTRFFFLEFGTAAVAAVTFAFAVYMLHGHNEPEFVFCASILPWAAYAALAFVERPGPGRLLVACMPVLLGYLGGYMPLGVACLAFAVLVVAARVILLDDAGRSLAVRAADFALALVPFVIATVIVAPYLFAVYLFQAQSPSAGAPSLFFSAHQLADAPQAVLRLLSSRFPVPGPYYEFSVTWGLAAVTIVALFFTGARTFEVLTSREWLLLKMAAVVYFATVLATFGEYSAMSDLVYYFVPQVGKMHIYQRFLLPAQLLFGVMLGLMVRSLVVARPAGAMRVALAFLALATLACAYLVGKHAAIAQDIGINNYIVFELGLAFLLVLALMMPGRHFAYAVTTAVIALPALDVMYDYSHGGHTLQEQQKRQVVALDDSVRAGFLKYLKRFAGRDLVKYVDLTPMWTEGLETFPKSFPYLVLDEITLSSYTGFNFYLSSGGEYMRRMPIVGNVQMQPDWNYVAASGADFVVLREADFRAGVLGPLMGEVKDEDVYRLPRGVVAVPFRPAVDRESSPVAFDNGYLRLVAGATAAAAPAKQLENIALHKKARQVSTGGGEASRAVDGNPNGVLEQGSVASTAQDRNAWFEIDLGAVEPIDSVRIWNRTDGPGFRLRDFWLLVSESPFGDTDTAARLRARPDVWSRLNGMPNPVSTIPTPGVRGRYVRIQFGGNQPLDESWLSLAEVEVFRADPASPPPAAAARPPMPKASAFATNKANYFALTVDAPAPATVEYLLWKNPRLSFYVNGSRVEPLERDGLVAINVPAGHSVVEIRYRNWSLRLFWTMLVIYVLAGVWLAALAIRVAWRSRRAGFASPGVSGER